MIHQVSLDEAIALAQKEASFSSLVKIKNEPAFGGTTFEEKIDGDRLRGQLRIVFDMMKDGRWRTPEEMEKITGFRWASINARLRDLRKARFGGFTVNRKRVAGGQFAYQLIVTTDLEN